MKKLFLAAGVAALAIAAPAAGKPEDKGRDRDTTQTERGGKNRTAKAEKSGGREARAARSEQRVERERPQRIMASSKRQEDRARSERAERQEVRERPQRVERVERRAERPARVERQEQRSANRIDRQEVRADRQVNRIDRQDVRVERQANRIDRQELRAERVANRINRQNIVVRDWSDDDRPWIRARGLANACPPGLDRKNNGCLPPGQAKKLIGTVLPTAYRQAALPIGLHDVYMDTDDYYYRYGDGYLYQVNRRDNLVASLLPLFTGGYMPGQAFPSMYMNSYVPSYYQPFYTNTSDDYYRFANGYIYEIDGRSGLIEDVDPAFGYGYGVGQLMPSSYSYYNVPYQYRDYYYDTDDYYYRYAPGAIYQVDQGSSLITAVAALLSPGFGIGQPLPMGYSAYNVPYAYRSTYYDSPDAMYRYNNGYIYQVDPTTQLVSAIVRALV